MPSSLAEKLAPIILPKATGGEVRLGLLWERGPAVLVLLRHYGWIFCREHVAQLREQEDEFKEAGAELAAIGLGDLNYARFFQQESGIDFPLLVDEGLLAYRALELKTASLLHILRSDNARARSRARAAGHRQRWFGANPFQLGGSFVFAPGNRDIYAHVSATFGDNASVAELLRAAHAGHNQITAWRRLTLK